MVDDDERIAPFLKKLKYRYLGEDFSSSSHLQGAIQLSQINTVGDAVVYMRAKLECF